MTIKTKKVTWLTPYFDAWHTRYGGTMPCGVVAKVLKPLEAEHGPEETLRRWIVYLTSTDGRFVSPARFASTWGEWGRLAPVKAPLSRYEATVTELADQRHEATVALETKYQSEAHRVGARWAKDHPDEFAPIKAHVERSYHNIPKLFSGAMIKAELTQRCAKEAGFPSFEAWMT